MKKIWILGYGEIGQSIAKFYKNPMIADKNECNFVEGMDIIHVCIPYSKDFEKIVLNYNKKYNPKYIIIHSTVKVGTTSSLNKKLNGKVIHSPVRGVHPNLYEAIQVFVKYIGYDNIDTAIEIGKHFNDLGIVFRPAYSKETELGKLLSTTYYGMCIAFHDYANRLCKKEGLDFDIVMTDFNSSYNEGYTKLNMKNVVRPVLYPPKGKIGGHCVIPNAKILKQQFGKNSILDSILNVR